MSNPSIMGMSPDAVLRVAAKLSAEAVALEDRARWLTTYVNRTSWKGPDAERFRASTTPRS